jgi:hypothetical protein
MSKATIENVVRTRNSARARMASLRKIRISYRQRRMNNDFETESYDSPLMSCGDVFEDSVRNIEREYESMLNRIDNATVNL